jgi:hypothetical protein
LYDPLHKEQPEALEEMDKVIVVVDQQKMWSELIYLLSLLAHGNWIQILGVGFRFLGFTPSKQSALQAYTSANMKWRAPLAKNWFLTQWVTVVKNIFHYLSTAMMK